MLYRIGIAYQTLYCLLSVEYRNMHMCVHI